MTILAIETSCDETAIAVLRGFDTVVLHEITSQADLHALYGGVVPEVASRNHLAILPRLIEESFSRCGLALSDIDAFAATTGPGLAAALLVGASAAKGLALGSGKPFLAVNHLEGHLLSPFFGEAEVPPHVSLVVSGGHTLLFDVRRQGEYRLMGRTLDDAAGEAFDKVAKMLGLPYPGGAEIDRLAREGRVNAFDFPRSMVGSGDLNFSFSGLKTSVRYFLEKGFDTASLPDICASFQEAVVDVLVAKAMAAAAETGHDTLAVSGGVSSNGRLQEKLADACARAGISLRLAPRELRTDNALMIAYAAAHHASEPSPLHCEIRPNFDECLSRA